MHPHIFVLCFLCFFAIGLKDCIAIPTQCKAHILPVYLNSPQARRQLSSLGPIYPINCPYLHPSLNRQEGAIYAACFIG